MIITGMMIYPLVNIQKTIEHMAIEIVSFPMKNGDLSIDTLVYQRVVRKLVMINSLMRTGIME